MYLAGQCCLCGKIIWTKEKYERADNVVCEMLVCIDCHNKTLELLTKTSESLQKEIKKNKRHSI